MREIVQEGDYIALYTKNKKRKYIVRAETGKTIHTNEGAVELSSIIGAKYGETCKSNVGEPLLISKPSFIDLIYSVFKRRTQILYPKDVAAILLLSGVAPGARVVEAGTGSGVLTAFLARLAAPDGKIFSYDIRKDCLKIARENLARVGLADKVELKLQDITEGIEEENVDAVVLDMPSPWLVVNHAWTALKPGGSYTAFIPTFNQMERVVEKLRKTGFVEIKAFEIIERPFKVKTGETRPETLIIGHTGYIVYGKKP